MRFLDLFDRLTRILGRVVIRDASVDSQLAAVSAAGAVKVDGSGATQPVSGTVNVREGTVPMTWVSSKTAAPVASAVQADTGALAAGDYDFDVYMVVSDTVAVGKGLVVEHRDAANAATLQTLGGVSTQGELAIYIRRYTIALNQRIRVIAGTAAGAAASMYISAIGRRLT